MSDVIEHSEIDLDMTAINTAVGLGDYAAAYTIYTDGANSVKSSSSTGFRSLSSFSKALSGEDEWQAGRDYWGSDTYADSIVNDALSGSDYTYMYEQSWGSCCECARARACAISRLVRARASARARRAIPYAYLMRARAPRQIQW